VKAQPLFCLTPVAHALRRGSHKINAENHLHLDTERCSFEMHEYSFYQRTHQPEASLNMQRPKNAIVILLDSLNRHMLGCYGGSEFRTPQIDRFAARSTRFDRHYTGSLPCMPARHDLLCGSLDFLWKCWGSVEIWEDNLSAVLGKAGIATQLISDHPHLFEIGGENYHCDFEAWSYERGH